MKQSGRTLKKNEMLRIKAFPRIHVSLIGMNRDGYRINGGIGFSISSPTMDMAFAASDSIEIVDKREHGFTYDELKRLVDHLRSVVVQEHLDVGIKCEICEGIVRSHIGFGSNSMIYLSCIEALFLINHRDYDEKEIIRLSGRGGTSGIGINTYFKGGFVFDAGIANTEHRALSPSSSFVKVDHPEPLLMKSLTIPEWEMGVCIPSINHKTEKEEVEFFQENCPIDKKDVEDVLYDAVYGITSSIMENDFETFCKAIDSIQHTKWKQLERALYGLGLSEVEANIRGAGACCVGMSSLGPLLYFFGDNIDGIIERIERSVSQVDCFKTSLNNLGRVVAYD